MTQIATETKKTEMWASLLALPFLLAVCVALWIATATPPAVTVQSEGDVWDLRGFDFSDSETIARLSGPVAFIPNALLTPEEFEARADEIRYGNPEDVSRYATCRMRVLLPDGWYYVTRLSTDYAERLYVNGELLFEIGRPGDSRETEVPNTLGQNMTLKPENGVIEFVMQSSNFVHREGGGYAGWRIGNPETGRGGGYLTSIVMGCFLALFLVHGILFVLLRTYRANLLFALFCLMWFLRAGVTWTKVFSVVLPQMSWVVKFRIEYLSLPVTAVLFVALVQTLFPGILQKWFRRAMAGAMAVFAALFLFADTVLMSHAIQFTYGILYAAILYIAARFVMKLRKVRPEQLVFLMGAVIFMYSSANDMLAHNNFTNLLFFPFLNRDMTQISMLIFTLFEAAAIFIATAREIGEAKAQEQRLAFENAALTETARVTEQLISLRWEQYEQIAEKAEQVRVQRHDLRHQLAVVRGYNSSGDAEKLTAYLDELTSRIPPPDERMLCENFAVNAVALHYLSLAESKEITVSISLPIPANTSRVRESDLCVIVGNLFENAIEACARQTQGERFIRLAGNVQYETLTITMDNSFDGQTLNVREGMFFSSKREGMGVGLSSTIAVAKKYGGNARFEAQGNVFMSSVYVIMAGATGNAMAADKTRFASSHRTNDSLKL